MLLERYGEVLTEAGCDEAGRGCLAGPVFAAAVILPPGFSEPLLNDSKQLTAARRDRLRVIIERDALAWSVASLGPDVIDRVNILQASIMAMHEAVTQLRILPGFLLIDGNRFNPYPGIAHVCIVGGDGRYQAIAAASILAKTHRDEYMTRLHHVFPEYNWAQNKGYPSAAHRNAIALHGPTPHHRLSFRLLRD